MPEKTQIEVKGAKCVTCGKKFQAWEAAELCEQDHTKEEAHLRKSECCLHCKEGETRSAHGTLWFCNRHKINTFAMFVCDNFGIEGAG